ncbi:unannotated protein [freshwater metagenome]|uniref:Unannotated protein n=1 Tax=freshwater metagenome TaxID=449393 RepID=A0A6J6BKI8_9ZZZZ|nr:TSUP family transporter [Actinomycetota bacterium]
METALALIAGGFIGAVLGFVGAGGAMLSVPILMYGFGFDPKPATTAALAVVLLAALSGLIPKAKKKQVLYRDAFVIWGIGSITNLGFSSIVDQIPDLVITTGFSAILLLAGASMLRPPKLEDQKRLPLPFLIVMSLIIGTITGLFGIGGGFLVIPVLVLYFGTPQIVATGTSLLIISANSLTAFIGHREQWSDVQWHIPILMGASAVIVAQIASQTSHKTSPVVLRKSFAYLLFVISIFTLIKTYL